MSKHQHPLPAHSGPGTSTATTKAAIAADDKDHNAPVVSAESIRLFAYQKWVRAGHPTGDGVQFWLEAEQALSQRL